MRSVGKHGDPPLEEAPDAIRRPGKLHVHDGEVARVGIPPYHSSGAAHDGAKLGAEHQVPRGQEHPFSHRSAPRSPPPRPAWGGATDRPTRPFGTPPRRPPPAAAQRGPRG